MRRGVGAVGLMLMIAAMSGCGSARQPAHSADVAVSTSPSAPADLSSAEYADVLVAGVITKYGRPMAHEAVDVSLSSDADVKVGEMVPTKNLPVGVTDSNGQYLVRIDRKDVDAKFMSGKLLNFEMFLSSAGDDPFAIFDTTAAYVPRHGRWEALDADATHTGPKLVDFDFGTRTIAEHNGDGTTTKWKLVIFPNTKGVGSR
jgi:hypothetical protein